MGTRLAPHTDGRLVGPNPIRRASGRVPGKVCRAAAGERTSWVISRFDLAIAVATLRDNNLQIIARPLAAPVTYGGAHLSPSALHARTR